jgi:osmotically inducible protein OsmC
MPRIVREAHIVWEGTTARGSGVVSAVSSGAFELPTTNASRIGDPEGKTSPEELLAAAHAACFVTSLGSELARAGTRPQRLEVGCRITMDEVEGIGHRIVSSAITARGFVPGSDAAAFAQAAEEADTGCPFSALIKASATVTVDATLEGGRDGD